MTDLYFEDFKPGDRFVSDGVTVTEAMIVDFALTYDPQPFHIDAEAARASNFGGLIASGFQTLALGFRMLIQTGVFRKCGMGSPGLDELRWPRPVRPGDTLHSELEIIELRPSQSKMTGTRPDLRMRSHKVCACQCLRFFFQVEVLPS